MASCSSSIFTVISVSTPVETSTQCSVAGYYGEGELTYNQELCLLCPKWCSYWGIPYPCGWYWCDCTDTVIPIVPAFDINASCNIPMVITSDVEYVLQVTGQSVMEASSVTINSFDLNLTISIAGAPVFPVTINFPDTVTLSQVDGSFSTTLPIFTWNEVVSGYGFTITANLLFCADPIPPLSWFNLQLVCDVDFDGYSESFTIGCPLIAVIS